MEYGYHNEPYATFPSIGGVARLTPTLELSFAAVMIPVLFYARDQSGA